MLGRIHRAVIAAFTSALIAGGAGPAFAASGTVHDTGWDGAHPVSGGPADTGRGAVVPVIGGIGDDTGWD